MNSSLPIKFMFTVVLMESKTTNQISCWFTNSRNFQDVLDQQTVQQMRGSRRADRFQVSWKKLRADKA